MSHVTGAGDSKGRAWISPQSFLPGRDERSRDIRVTADTCLGYSAAQRSRALCCQGSQVRGNICHQAAAFCCSIYTSSPDSESQARKHSFLQPYVCLQRGFFQRIGDNWGCHPALWAKFCSISQTTERLLPATTSKSVQAVLGIKSFFFVLLFRSLPCVAKQLLMEG